MSDLFKKTDQTPHPIHILHVEDSAFDREFFREIFKNSEISSNITDCLTGEEAIKYLHKDASLYHIIVIDQTLPGMTGLELCKTIMTEAIDLPIVLLTGTGTEEIAVEAMRLGIDGYIIKGSAEHKKLLPLRIAKAVNNHANRKGFNETEQRLKTSEEQYRNLIETSHDMIWMCDVEGRFTYLNPAWEKILGYRVDEMIGRHFSEFKPADVLERDRKTFEETIKKGSHTFGYETKYLTKKGEEVNVVINAKLIRNDKGEITGTQGTIHDNTEQKKAEGRLQSLNRALKSLSQCNRAVMQVTSEPKLLNEICRIITETGGYPLAWVGYAEHDKNKNVRVMAKADAASTYLGDIKIAWSDTKLGRGPTGTAIRTGVFSVLNNMSSHKDYTPWLKKAEQYGIKSSLALPLLMDKTAFGALNIYSLSPGAFIDEEVKLLEELAENLAFGIKALRLKNERKAADEQLRSLDKALRTTRLGVTITGIEGNILYTNPADAEMHGYNPAELIGKDVRIFAPPELRNPLSIAELKRMGSRSVESVNIRKNGERFPVYLISDIVTDALNKPVGFVTTCEDITERKRAEEATRESEGRLQSIMDNSFAAIFVKDLNGYYIMANKSLSHLLQRPKDEIIGKTDYDLFPEEVAKELQTIDKKVFNSEEPIFMEDMAPFPDGTVHAFITNKFPLKDTEGNVYAICGISTDITRRKSAEEETLRSNILLESIRLAQAEFIDEAASEIVFDELLNTLLALTESEYGFIGEINRDKEGVKLLKGRIATNIEWSREVQGFYDRKAAGLILANMNTLYGEVVKSGQVVIANDAANDPRRGTLPKEHPPIKSFMGLPIYLGKSLIGMAGVANRTGGYAKDVAEFLEPFLSTCGTIMDAATVREDREKAERKLEDSHEQLRNLVTRMETVIEEERKRIARDIHDELGQLLTVIKFDISWLAKKLSRADKPIIQKLADTSKLADSTIESVQRISAELRPTLLDDLGIVAGMEWQASEFQGRTDILCILTFEPNEIHLEEKLSTEIYRIFQESLTNVARHSGASKVIASLKLKGENLTLEVSDNGRGISEQEIDDNRSIGLIGIRERIHPWKGEVQIRGEEGKGTTLKITVPTSHA